MSELDRRSMRSYYNKPKHVYIIQKTDSIYIQHKILKLDIYITIGNFN